MLSCPAFVSSHSDDFDLQPYGLWLTLSFTSTFPHPNPVAFLGAHSHSLLKCIIFLQTQETLAAFQVSSGISIPWYHIQYPWHPCDNFSESFAKLLALSMHFHAGNGYGCFLLLHPWPYLSSDIVPLDKFLAMREQEENLTLGLKDPYQDPIMVPSQPLFISPALTPIPLGFYIFIFSIFCTHNTVSPFIITGHTFKNFFWNGAWTSFLLYHFFSELIAL